jgi:hypothetical protein
LLEVEKKPLLSGFFYVCQVKRLVGLKCPIMGSSALPKMASDEHGLSAWTFKAI